MKATTNTFPNNSRNSSLDALRTIAIFAVILIHLKPYTNLNTSWHWELIAITINQSARFAVPFFFLASGYLLSTKSTQSAQEINRSPIIKQMLRLFIIIISWSLIYLLFIPDYVLAFTKNGVARSIYWNLIDVFNDPWHLLASGTRIHLWFINALFWSLALILVWVTYFRARAGLFLAIGIYILGLSQGAYSWYWYAIFPQDLSPPPNQLFGVSLVLLGWWLAQSDWRPRLIHSIFLAALGMLLHFSEVILLMKYQDQSPWQQDILIGTGIWSLGLLLLALAKPNLARGWAITTWGRWTLGIYAVHLVIQDALTPLTYQLEISTICSQTLLPVMVYMVSLLIAIVLSKLKYLQQIAQ
jgi:surface polysaccharide O-acyltransferase-like enzyme